MTFAQWAKNNSKINDGKDFDETYLQGIFERISKTPLKLNDNTPGAPAPVEEQVSYIFKILIFIKTCTNCKTKHVVYTSCYRQALVKYMLEATWQPLVDVLDFFMQNCDVCLPLVLLFQPY